MGKCWLLAVLYHLYNRWSPALHLLQFFHFWWVQRGPFLHVLKESDHWNWEKLHLLEWTWSDDLMFFLYTPTEVWHEELTSCALFSFIPLKYISHILNISHVRFVGLNINHKWTQQLGFSIFDSILGWSNPTFFVLFKLLGKSFWFHLVQLVAHFTFKDVMKQQDGHSFHSQSWMLVTLWWRTLLIQKTCHWKKPIM